MPMWVEAFLWGAGTGSALILGAAIAWRWSLSSSVVATVMAFGCGVLLSALAFDLMAEAIKSGGLWPTSGGFLVGTLAYVTLSALLARAGAPNRKRSTPPQPGGADQDDSGTAIALGALLDGIPESVVLGISLLAAGTINPAILGAVVISNVPEGLSSTASMKKAGHSARYVFIVWGGIALSCGVAALLGYTLLANAATEALAFMTATAAGAMLVMVATTMLPQAFARQHTATGLITALGFLAAFIVHHLGG